MAGWAWCGMRRRVSEAAIPWDLLRVDLAGQAPLYLQLTERVAAAIAAQQLPQGQALPAERALCERLGLSRTTVRKAVKELAVRGLVAARHGSGTFVAARLDQPLARLSSFTDDMRARGRFAGSRVVDRGVRFPSPDEAVALALTGGEQVTFLVRLRLADGEPLALDMQRCPSGCCLIRLRSGSRCMRRCRRGGPRRCGRCSGCGRPRHRRGMRRIWGSRRAARSWRRCATAIWRTGRRWSSPGPPIGGPV